MRLVRPIGGLLHQGIAHLPDPGAASERKHHGTARFWYRVPSTESGIRPITPASSLGRIVKVRFRPMDQFRDFKELLPALSIKTIFDVGANKGQSARAFRKACREADIYAFEPVQATFALLTAAVENDQKTRCFRTALGNQQATLKMEAKPGSLKNRIGDGDRGVDVEVDTGDHFCAVHGIGSINFLKIDAEGYDLKVCQGFARMFETQAIELVQVEAGLNPQNQRHVPLQAFREYLEPFGYSLFRIYDQAGQPIVSRCNAMFISREMAKMNPKPPKIRAKEPAAWL